MSSYSEFLSTCKNLEDAYKAAAKAEQQVISKLVEATKEHGQRPIASHLEFSAPYINDLVHGRRVMNRPFILRVLDRGMM